MEEENKNNEVAPVEEVKTNTPVTQTTKETVQNPNNFEEVPRFQEVEPQKKKAVRTDSYFDGGVLELIGWRILATLITVVTLGIANPWAQCMLYSWQFKHTVYNGKRLKFVGTGGDLFVNIFKWIFFSIITLGIYLFFVPIKKTRWIISNLHFEDEEYVRDDSYFDGKTLQLIGINILTKLITLCSFGLLFPFATCIKIKWIKKHTIINRKRLVFDGTGFQLWGKYLLWCFLSIITLGIFTLWLPILISKWEAKHVHIKTVGEEEKKDKTLLILIPIAIVLAAGIIALITFVVMPKLAELDIGDDEFNLSNLFGLKNVTSETAIQEYNSKAALVENSKAVTSATETKKTSISVGGYTLALGTYKGTITQGVWDDTTMTSKARYIDVVVVLSEDTIKFDGRTTGYKIIGTEIRPNGTDFLMFAATGNNKITYYAETCPVLTYQGY